MPGPGGALFPHAHPGLLSLHPSRCPPHPPGPSSVPTAWGPRGDQAWPREDGHSSHSRAGILFYEMLTLYNHAHAQPRWPHLDARMSRLLPVSQWRGHLGLGSPHSLFLVSFLIKMEQLFLPLCSTPGGLPQLVAVQGFWALLLVGQGPALGHPRSRQGLESGGTESVGRGEHRPSRADPLGGTGARPGRGLQSVP